MVAGMASSIEPTDAASYVRSGFVVAAALVLVVAVTAAVITDDAPTPRPPSLAGAAANGLIAYSYAGDIYVGDPVTGETTAIVAHRTYEVNPVFSPDGTRIAFMRGDPEGDQLDASVLVVRADGWDERVVMPKGFSKRGAGPFAWTPDGASLVIGHDDEATGYIDGDLSLFDADGEAEPRRFAPPLPSFPGAVPFNPSARVAPMFRPPDGDLILGNQGPDALRVFDASSLKSVGQLLPKRYEGNFVEQTTWSPDGARVAFQLYGGDLDSSLFVVDADGSDLRRLDDLYDSLQWSPDGSKIAHDREYNEPDRPTGVIVITDLASGTERVLEATRAPQKKGAQFPTVTSNTAHTWYHEGWSWAPDGRSLLVLENHRTRPWVVDIATDTVTELPWLADSMPSWQPVAR
jgi:dipeptidyl aminopeptidase/acylaminoacyl peptidase